MMWSSHTNTGRHRRVPSSRRVARLIDEYPERNPLRYVCLPPAGPRRTSPPREMKALNMAVLLQIYGQPAVALPVCTRHGGRSSNLAVLRVGPRTDSQPCSLAPEGPEGDDRHRPAPGWVSRVVIPRDREAGRGVCQDFPVCLGSVVAHRRTIDSDDYLWVSCFSSRPQVQDGRESSKSGYVFVLALLVTAVFGDYGE